MSNQQQEVVYDRASLAIPFAIEQFLKGMWTAMPGVVDSYNRATRRARVSPAIAAEFTDGTVQKRGLLVNVPVVSPACDGFLITFALKKGDPVLLVFSMRGLAAFKKDYEAGASPGGGMFAASDAMAIPGFGPPQTDMQFRTPDDVMGMGVDGMDTGISIQSKNGKSHISIGNDGIVISAPSIKFVTTAAQGTPLTVTKQVTDY